MTCEHCGWRPPAREITTAAGLEALPEYTVVLDAGGDAWQRSDGTWWHAPTGMGSDSATLLAESADSVAVLHIPSRGGS